MKQLTVEHQAVFNFKTAVDQLRPVTETDVAQQEYRDFYDYFTSAISTFINCELNYRQAYRCTQVGINPDLASYSESMGERLNSKGIGYLSNALASFNSFSSQQTDLPVIGPEFQQELAAYKNDLREALVRLEMKGSDALELSNQIEAVANRMAPGNTGQQLLDYMGSKVSELIDVRNQPGRGADSNIAFWKLISAAVILCLGVWVIYRCYYSGWLCSKRERAIYNTIFTVALKVFGACE